MESTFYLLLALFFLGLNAFFVLAEFAIVKVRSTRLEELSEKGNRSARIAQEAVRHLDAYLSTCQLGITIASLGLGWVGEPAFTKMVKPVLIYSGISFSPTFLHTVSVAIGFTIITSLHVVVGELAPKNLAIRIPETSSLFVAIPLKIFHHIMFVPMWLLNTSANLILMLLKIKQSASEIAHTEDEIKIILNQSEELGKISLGRLMMFEHLFDFGKTKVKEIMTPRNQIAYITLEKTWEENLEIIQAKKHSRYPIAKSNIDDVLGFIHFKDIALSFLSSRDFCKEEINLLKFKREIHVIREETSAEKALREFQEKKIHMALVKNREEKVSGLLTMEDIVEELTGEIRDEFDKSPAVLLSRTINTEASIFNLQSKNRFEAIKAVIENLYSKYPNFDKEAAFNAIEKREKNFSTALGHQTAFPHARLETINKSILVFARAPKGINFPSPDNNPVKIIFLILTPFNDPTAQLKILSQLSALISNVTLRKKLFSAKKNEDLMDIIHAFENKVPQ